MSFPAPGHTVAELALYKSASDRHGVDIPALLFEATSQTDDRLYLKITDSQYDRWEIPEEVLPRPGICKD